MANTFEVITKYLPKAIDKYFAAESRSVILEHGSKFIDVSFDETGYVKIANVLLDGLSNYYSTQEVPGPSDPANYAAYAGNLGSGMRDGFAIGGVSLTWEIYKLQWCRGRQFRIDHISNEQSAKVVTGALIEEFHRLKVIPEVDACRFGVIADSASVSLGNLVTEALDAANAQSSGAYINTKDGPTGIIHHFNTAFEWLTKHEVPQDMQAIFVRPEIMTMIRNTSELFKRLTQEEYRSDKGVTFTITKYEGRPIIEVENSRFFTKVLCTSNGYQATSGSQAINYMVCSLRAVVPIRKLEYQKIYDEDMAGLAGFYGILMNYLLWHGVVIPKNKLIGTFVSVSAAGTALDEVNVLDVDIREGDVTNSWKLNAFFTRPSGMRGTVAYAGSAFTVGSAVTIDGSTIKAIAVNGQAVDAVNTQYYFALIDARGICIATTPSIVTLVKKS